MLQQKSDRVELLFVASKRFWGAFVAYLRRERYVEIVPRNCSWKRHSSLLRSVSLINLLSAEYAPH
jgi:hypothetical protein